MFNHKHKEGDVWTDTRMGWPDDREGPDPRIRSYTFHVESYDTLDDVKDPFSEEGEEDGNGFYSNEFKNMKSACNAYHRRVKRPHTKRCDLFLCVSFGTVFMTKSKVSAPQTNQAYMYISRWRADGAFVETYHVNEMKFAERELTEAENTPGLYSHWKKRKKNKN